MHQDVELFEVDPQNYHLPTRTDPAVGDWLKRTFKRVVEVFGRNEITPALKAYRSNGVQCLRCDLTGIDTWNNDAFLQFKIDVVCDGAVNLQDLSRVHVRDLTDAFWLIAYLGDTLKVEIRLPDLEIPF